MAVLCVTGQKSPNWWGTNVSSSYKYIKGEKCMYRASFAIFKSYFTNKTYFAIVSVYVSGISVL
jgi:hypothetical protein